VPLAFVHDSLTALGGITCPADLPSLMEAMTIGLGFSYYAILDHVDPRDSNGSAIFLTNYPELWIEHFLDASLFLTDPVLAACRCTHLGFCWSDLAGFIPLSRTQRDILEGARNIGLGAGFSIPVNVPGYRSGSCNFAVKCLADLPRANLLAAQLLGMFAFEAARRLSYGTERKPGNVSLTPRQLECIILAGQGKSDGVIAQLLNLSENSVTNYLTAARQRYGVATRTQLVTCALLDGHIGFST
jgi:LuxR family transcriptional regulator, quorum-sensing system regulator CciR